MTQLELFDQSTAAASADLPVARLNAALTGLSG